MAGELVVQVEPWGPDPDTADAAVRATLARSTDAAIGSPAGETRLLSLEQAGDEGDTEATSVRAVAYDYARSPA